MSVRDHPTNTQENLISHRETLQDHDSTLNDTAAVNGNSGVLETQDIHGAAINTINNSTIPAMPNVAVAPLYYWYWSPGNNIPHALFGLPRCVIHTMRSVCTVTWDDTSETAGVGFDTAGHYSDWMQNAEIAKTAGQVLDSNSTPVAVPGAAVVCVAGGTATGASQGETQIMFLYLPY
jgi:hypothetical protein